MADPKCKDIISMEIIEKGSSLKPGDHLAVQGETADIEYYHHGIFLSSEEGVIDFGGEDKQSAKIRKLDLLEFKGERKLFRIKYPDGKCLKPDVVIERAKQLKENPSLGGKYDLVQNNCEHFATRCKTGTPVSYQVNQKIREFIEDNLEKIAEKVAVSSAMFFKKTN